ncbi:MAG: PqqD family protein [Candidatus Saccharibacteria bacterium]
MSDKEADIQAQDDKAFIPKELRPSINTEDECAVIAPNASKAELRQRAGEVLGPLLKSKVINDPDAAMQVTREHICIRNEKVVFKEIVGEAVLLDLDSGFYFTLNRPGALIWSMLEEGKTLGEVHDAVCQQFEVAPATAWDDLVLLVRHLNREKLVRLEAPPGD